MFDLLHVGHLKHFKEAKTIGDILIVSVTSDRYVDKGPGRPIFSQSLRLEALNSISEIDYIVLSDFADATNIIKLIKPNIYFKSLSKY